MFFRELNKVCTVPGATRVLQIDLRYLKILPVIPYFANQNFHRKKYKVDWYWWNRTCTHRCKHTHTLRNEEAHSVVFTHA